MSAAMMISAIEHAMLLAESEGLPEHLVRHLNQLESELAAIMDIVEVALSGLPEGDPVRADLEEIKLAAELAVSKAKLLVKRTSRARSKPLLRAI